MYIKNIQLRNFRNYENAYIEFNPSINLITGENAQGKTNLLESLVYLSLTRSHRIVDDKKLIRNDEMFAKIDCRFVDTDEKDIEVIIHPNGKTLMIHKRPLKKSSEFIGLLNVVLFSPDDLRIFNDQPKERRRVMNQEITKVSTKYLLSLNQFQMYLKDRNALLKSEKIDFNYLDILDERISKVEAYIIRERRKFIEVIQSVISKIYQDLSGSQIQLEVAYKTFIDDTDNLEEKILEIHRESRQKDIEYHITKVGIHLDDLIFKMDDQNLIYFASQGQKRMAMLSFKLALLNYIKLMTKKQPILLLDDVLSELDYSRQKKLLQMVQRDFQCIITTTEIPDFLKHADMMEFHIEDGKIFPLTGGK